MVQLSSPYKSISFGDDCLLFKQMSKCELDRLSKSARLRVLTKQQYLFTQHAPSDRLYNIVSGVGIMEKVSENGRRQIFTFVYPGDLIGLSNTEKYSYGVKSLSNLTVYEFKRQNLLALAEELPTLGANLREIRSDVTTHTFEHVYLLGQLKAYERVCFMLIQLLNRLPGAKPDKIDLPMTRTDIADYLGLTVETVSRTFSQLKRDGLISITSNNTISILNLESIEDLASTA
ncbi:helix-turn-helix domain-containing protein [Aliiglaciecola sp. 3_MG-2023]|uniref:Crp/Fnr family transcriptional regulator n=1 Tax=Aliiglaciecola sp. 3_MG-2023 TaxID=3062644 RepID=UPI0026E19BF4|nr:helix-turn-helix domain-containing protein [Aliiglaciecola sp. 3_MG-2023]MDO6693094.1 helix-turn-helix domain-containing protein [Aliiglaciecola sp. 3_MG-2023]